MLHHDERLQQIAETRSRRRATCSISAAAPPIPMALEGALKLKEISYIHAEGYAAGEMKHGPIALIDENVPVIVAGALRRLFEKTASNVEEVMARGGRVIVISDAAGVARLGAKALAVDRGARRRSRSSRRSSTRSRSSSSPITSRC